MNTQPPPQQIETVLALVRIADYPQLKAACWNRSVDAVCTEPEALALYERNWRFVDKGALTPDEVSFVDRLVRVHGSGVLHV